MDPVLSQLLSDAGSQSIFSVLDTVQCEELIARLESVASEEEAVAEAVYALRVQHTDADLPLDDTMTPPFGVPMVRMTPTQPEPTEPVLSEPDVIDPMEKSTPSTGSEGSLKRPLFWGVGVMACMTIWSLALYGFAYERGLQKGSAIVAHFGPSITQPHTDLQVPSVLFPKDIPKAVLVKPLHGPLSKQKAMKNNRLSVQIKGLFPKRSSKIKLRSPRIRASRQVIVHKAKVLALVGDSSSVRVGTALMPTPQLTLQPQKTLPFDPIDGTTDASTVQQPIDSLSISLSVWEQTPEPPVKQRLLSPESLKFEHEPTSFDQG